MAASAPIPVERYQPGGDIYNRLVSEYGTAGADTVAQAAQSGDREQITNALEYLRGHPAAQTDSTAAIFLNQLITDPLAAPLESLDNTVKKVFDSSGVKTLVVVGIVGIVALIIVNAKLKG